jgi:two-component system invasion response regulator UvrY
MIRIAIVDDHAMVRAGLRQFFADQVDFQVVAEAASGREAMDIVRQGEVDVVLLDISMPGQSGVDALAAIRARAPTLPVLILSGFAEEHYASHAAAPGRQRLPQQGLRPRRDHQGHPHRGARPQVHHRDDGRTAGRRPGQRRRRPRTSNCPNASCRSSCAWPRARPSATSPLSMSLSVKTVSTYRSRVMEKMALASNSDLTYYALKHGLIQ